jgi:tetratricopeptide (TPR) repeat protein/tRNA A-37 threonylcarbamoyl transferase component Bud32
MADEQRVRDLFERVVDLAPEDRERLLLLECENDPDLYRELISLLTADRDATNNDGWRQSALDNAASLERQSPDAGLGKIIGSYRTVELLGKGGMGKVYRAIRIDSEYEKNVAIKIIRSGLDSEELAARFRAERQILANLEHPNIARLLDGGAASDGMPYLVMEYVEGTHPLDYCQRHALTTAQRIRLFRQICSAVHYAHQRMVIHRDLKPGNILVAHDGTPKLLDFGIAKVFAPEISATSQAHTETGMQRLTARYSSPEQIRGEAVTTVSDVFSLGVILYELLTGRSPYGGLDRSPLEVMNAVCHEAAPKPSGVLRELRGDVDNIIAKALQKDATARYASVDQFSDDLGCYLEGRPVHARGDAPLYLAQKFVRRNRLAVAAAAVVLCTLLAGFIEVTRARGRAERRFNEVRQLAHSVMFDYSDEIDRLPGSTPVRARLVKDALRYLENLSKEADTPALQQEIVDAYVRVSNVQGNEYQNNMGDTAGALDTSGKAAAAAEKLVAEQQTPSALSSAAEAFATDASLRYSAGDLSGADRQYQRAIKLREQVRSKTRDDVDNGIALSTDLRHMGDLYGGYGFHNLGRTAESVKFYQSSRDIASQLKPEAANQLVAVTKANYKALLSLSVSEGGIGRREDEARDLSEALSQIEKLSVAEPDDANVKIELANVEQRFGQVLLEGRRAPEAIPHMRRSVELLTGLADADPGNVMYRRSRSIVETQWAAALRGAGQIPAAIEHNRQALAIAEALSREAPQSAQYRADVASAERKLSESLLAGGDRSGAHDHAERSRAIFCGALGAASDTFTQANCGRALLSLGNALTKLTNTQQALEVYRSAEQTARRVSQADAVNAIYRSDLARSQVALAAGLGRVGQAEAAVDMYRESLANWSILRKANSMSAEDEYRSADAAQQMAMLLRRP